MADRKPVTPGSYPTTYRCMVCGHDIIEKEVLLGSARKVGDSLYVCPACIPTWDGERNTTVRELVTKKRKRNTFLKRCSDYLAKLKERSRDRIDPLDNLSSFLDVALDDPAMREQLLAIVMLDDHQRQMMLDPIIARLQLRDAPAELQQLMISLKEPSVAACARKILLERS